MRGSACFCVKQWPKWRVMFWKHLRSARRQFERQGDTPKERIDKLIAAAMAAPPDVQREMLRTLRDVSHEADALYTMLSALLPPDVTNGDRKNCRNHNGGSKQAG